MSALLCSPNHISAVATWAEKTRPSVFDREMAAELLAKANLESVGAYYGDSPSEAARCFQDDELENFLTDCSKPNPMPFLPNEGRRRELLPREIMHLCECLDYQCCHAPGWAESEAKALLDSILSEALDRRDGRGQQFWSI